MAGGKALFYLSSILLFCQTPSFKLSEAEVWRLLDLKIVNIDLLTVH